MKIKFLTPRKPKVDQLKSVQPRSNAPPATRLEEHGQQEKASSDGDSDIFVDASESFANSSPNHNDTTTSPQGTLRALQGRSGSSYLKGNARSEPRKTTEQRLEHENAVEDPKESVSLKQKARRVMLAKASTLGKTRSENFISTKEAAKATDAALFELEKAVTMRGSGLTKVQVDGILTLDGPDSVHLARIVGLEPLPVTAITPTILKKLHEEGHLRTTMTSFLAPKAVSMYLENEQSVKTRLSVSASTREPINLRQFAHLPLIYESLRKHHTHETARTSIACALACSCLRHNEHELFAEIISVAPKRLLLQLTTYPFEGNIFFLQNLS